VYGCVPCRRAAITVSFPSLGSNRAGSVNSSCHGPEMGFPYPSSWETRLWNVTRQFKLPAPLRFAAIFNRLLALVGRLQSDGLAGRNGKSRAAARDISFPAGLVGHCDGLLGFVVIVGGKF